MARSRWVWKLATNARVSFRSATGQPARLAHPQLRARLRSGEVAQHSDRSPLAVRRAAGPRGTGFVAAGSRMARNENSPEIAAILRFTVAGA